MSNDRKARDRSATLHRTRSAIITGAAAVLAANPAASMAEIADSVHMARSTVYRHFADRVSLQAAMKELADMRLSEIGQQLAGRSGSARELLLILCHAYFDEADLLMVAYGDRTQNEEIQAAAAGGHLDVLIAEGHRDGSVDAALPAAWVEQTLWALLYNAWLLATSKVVTRHEALNLFLRSFSKMLA